MQSQHRIAGGQTGDLLATRLTALELDRVRRRPVDSGMAPTRRFVSAASPGQVGDDQVRSNPHHATDQRDQPVDGDRHGGTWSQDDVTA